MSLKLLRRVPDKSYAQTVAAPYTLASGISVNAKATGTTTLYTVPAGLTIVVLAVVLRCTAAVSITVPATAGVGIASGEDDIFASQKLYGLTAADRRFEFPNGGAAAVANEGDAIKLGIDTAATGTSQTLSAEIIGYEV